MRETDKILTGIMFHHLDLSKVDIGDSEDSDLIGRLSQHNLAHDAHNDAAANRGQVKSRYDRLKKSRPEEYRQGQEALKLKTVNNHIEYTQKDIFNTNMALPTKLRGKHKSSI